MDTWGNWQGCTSSYPPGTGKLALQGQDPYSHHRDLAVWKHDKCWTNVYYVHDEVIQLPWRHLQDILDCNGTSTCTTNQDDGWSQCVTWTESFEERIGFEDIIGELFLQTSETFKIEYSNETCIKGSLSTGCTWNNGGCHALWGSDEVVRVWAYFARYCDYANDNQGEEIIWSHDFIIDFPTGKITTGCGALCNEQDYPGPQRAPPLNTATLPCTSAATWNALDQASTARQTQSFTMNENYSSQWIQALAYTTDVRTPSPSSTSVSTTISISVSVSTVTATSSIEVNNNATSSRNGGEQIHAWHSSFVDFVMLILTFLVL